MKQVLSSLFARLRRTREEADGGFSLVELIVVVAILGALVAIAVPVFGSIQETARANAVKAVAANGATQATAQLAAGETPKLIESGDPKITVAWGSDGKGAIPKSIDEVCVWASHTDDPDAPGTSGPGC